MLAFNTGALQPLRNLHMSATGGAPGGRGDIHKLAAEPMTTRREALQKMAVVSLFPAVVLGTFGFPGEAEAKGATAEVPLLLLTSLCLLNLSSCYRCQCRANFFYFSCSM